MKMSNIFPIVGFTLLFACGSCSNVSPPIISPTAVPSQTPAPTPSATPVLVSSSKCSEQGTPGPTVPGGITVIYDDAAKVRVVWGGVTVTAENSAYSTVVNALLSKYNVVGVTDYAGQDTSQHSTSSASPDLRSAHNYYFPANTDTKAVARDFSCLTFVKYSYQTPVGSIPGNR